MPELKIPYVFGFREKPISSSKMNANFTEIARIVNSLDDANVPDGGLGQPKIRGLITDLAAKLARAGDTMTGTLIIDISTGNAIRFVTGTTEHGRITFDAKAALKDISSPTATLKTANIETGNIKEIKVDTAIAGIATLVAGTVTINTTKVTTTSLIFLTKRPIVATPTGILYVSAITAGVSFTVTSSVATDTDSFSWLIINQ